MARVAGVTLDWGDGTYEFNLMKVGGWVEFQDKCDCGPEWAHKSIPEKTWKFQYIREAIRIGLIGGGMKPAEALRLVKVYCDTLPMYDNALIAYAVLSAAIFGVEDEPLGKSQGEKDQSSSLFPEENTDGPTSTESGP